MSAPLHLAVFDVDGTLVDSQHMIVQAMTQAMTDHGFDAPAPAAVRHIIGLSIADAVAALLPGAAPERVQAVADGYKAAYFALRSSGTVTETLFPGIVDVLARLDREGWLLGLATGKTRRGVESLLERHAVLSGRFLTRQTADGNPSKPHPAMLQKAMAETGVEAPFTVMIGDTTYDMTMARQAGTLALGVSWGYHSPQDLAAAGAHAIVDDVARLPEAIAGLTRSRPCAWPPS
ncbi:MAG: HAD-IA family hydrolase [Rhodospirillaceae bacterium]|nr:HAD-IA family hydrolase [Rhodospirillaceae bacterium]